MGGAKCSLGGLSVHKVDFRLHAEHICEDAERRASFGEGEVRMRTWMWWLERAVLGVLVAGVLLVAGDWAAWRVRGSPMGSVRVSRVVVAPLKGHREEYYPDGTTDEVCARSMLPWGGVRACWWVQRQRFVEER